MKNALYKGINGERKDKKMKWKTLKNGNTVSRKKGIKFVISKTNTMPNTPYSVDYTQLSTGLTFQYYAPSRTINAAKKQVEKLMASYR